jgi:hypothetical protein
MTWIGGNAALLYYGSRTRYTVYYRLVCFCIIIISYGSLIALMSTSYLIMFKSLIQTKCFVQNSKSYFDFSILFQSGTHNVFFLLKHVMQYLASPH